MLARSPNLVIFLLMTTMTMTMIRPITLSLVHARRVIIEKLKALYNYIFIEIRESN